MTEFKDVIGRKDLIEYIQRSVTQDTVSHAYILCGERGSGKGMLAALFATILQCEKGGQKPCHACHSCRQMESGNQPDVIYISHEKPASISVDEIRAQINNDVMIKPYSSKYKIYIIPEADLMTPQAQNALLRTVEEPPEYAVFFLLTENAENLLPTIRSRCVMLRLRNVKDALIKMHLMEQLQVPDYKAAICTAFAQGNVGRAIMLASSDHFNEIKDDAIKLMRNIRDMDVSDVSAALKDISKYKMEISDYLDIITIWFRDVLLYKATMDIDGVVFSDQMEFIKERAKKSSYEGIEIILESLERAKARLRANVNYDLIMELLLLTIKEN